MTKEEFIELHGVAAWQLLVIPRSLSRGFDANKYVHFTVINPILGLLGFKSSSLLGCRALLQKQKECQHETINKETIRTSSRNQQTIVEFERKECGNCGQFLGDKNLRAVG